MVTVIPKKKQFIRDGSGYQFEVPDVTDIRNIIETTHDWHAYPTLVKWSSDTKVLHALYPQGAFGQFFKLDDFRNLQDVILNMYLVGNTKNRPADFQQEYWNWQIFKVGFLDFEAYDLVGSKQWKSDVILGGGTSPKQLIRSRFTFDFDGDESDIYPNAIVVLDNIGSSVGIMNIMDITDLAEKMFCPHKRFNALSKAGPQIQDTGNNALIWPVAINYKAMSRNVYPRLAGGKEIYAWGRTPFIYDVNGKVTGVNLRQYIAFRWKFATRKIPSFGVNVTLQYGYFAPQIVSLQFEVPFLNRPFLSEYRFYPLACSLESRGVVWGGDGKNFTTAGVLNYALSSADFDKCYWIIEFEDEIIYSGDSVQTREGLLIVDVSNSDNELEPGLYRGWWVSDSDGNRFKIVDNDFDRIYLESGSPKIGTFDIIVDGYIPRLVLSTDESNVTLSGLRPNTNQSNVMYHVRRCYPLPSGRWEGKWEHYNPYSEEWEEIDFTQLDWDNWSGTESVPARKKYSYYHRYSDGNYTSRPFEVATNNPCQITDYYNVCHLQKEFAFPIVSPDLESGEVVFSVRSWQKALDDILNQYIDDATKRSKVKSNYSAGKFNLYVTSLSTARASWLSGSEIVTGESTGNSVGQFNFTEEDIELDYPDTDYRGKTIMDSENNQFTIVSYEQSIYPTWIKVLEQVTPANETVSIRDIGLKRPELVDVDVVGGSVNGIVNHNDDAHPITGHTGYHCTGIMLPNRPIISPGVRVVNETKGSELEVSVYLANRYAEITEESIYAFYGEDVWEETDDIKVDYTYGGGSSLTGATATVLSTIESGSGGMWIAPIPNKNENGKLFDPAKNFVLAGVRPGDKITVSGTDYDVTKIDKNNYNYLWCTYAGASEGSINYSITAVDASVMTVDVSGNTAPILFASHAINYTKNETEEDVIVIDPDEGVLRVNAEWDNGDNVEVSYAMGFRWNRIDVKRVPTKYAYKFNDPTKAYAFSGSVVFNLRKG